MPDGNEKSANVIDVFRKQAAEKRPGRSRGVRPSGLLALLLRCFRHSAHQLKRLEQSESTLAVIVTNIFVLLEPLELFEYVVTFVALATASPHLARRLHVIDSKHSNLFVRPVRFLLTTGTILGVIVWLAGDQLPSSLSHILPENEWQRVVVLGAFALGSPLLVAALALLVKLPILLGAFVIPKKRLKDPEVWWAIPFLCDPRTWAKTRVPQIYQYLLYAGPYAILMSSIIAAVALLPLSMLERFVQSHPGRLSPEAAVLFFRLAWAGVWGVYAEIFVVNRFTAGLPMVMTAPTYALIRMVNPRLYQEVQRLKALAAAIGQSRSAREIVEIFAVARGGELFIELEFGVFVFRLLHFPFKIDFIELYDIRDLLDALADVYVDASEPKTLILHVRDVLKGTLPSIFEAI